MPPGRGSEMLVMAQAFIEGLPLRVAHVAVGQDENIAAGA